MKVVIVTGSVASGKTTLAKIISDYLGFKLIDVNQIIRKHKLSEDYDNIMRCNIIDPGKLTKVLIYYITKLSKVNKGIVIDSHLSHYLPKKYVDFCIVTRCNLQVLEKRLKKRRYPKIKIKENLEAEIFETCLTESKENRHRVFVIDTTKDINLDKLLRSAPWISKLKN